MKFWVLLFVCLAALTGTPPADAAEESESAKSNSTRVELVIFWEPGCPYCKRAKAFLEQERKAVEREAGAREGRPRVKFTSLAEVLAALASAPAT